MRRFGKEVGEEERIVGSLSPYAVTPFDLAVGEVTRTSITGNPLDRRRTS